MMCLNETLHAKATYVMTACRTAVEARSSRVWPRERMTKGMASSSVHTREEREGASEP